MKTRSVIAPCCLVFLLGAQSGAAGAPSAPTTNDTFSDGSSVTLVGASFGAGTAPLLWSKMESGTAGGVLNAAPEVGVWHVHGDRTRYTNTDYHSGSMSAYSIRNAGTTGYYNVRTAYNNLIQQADKLYVSYWFKYADHGSSGEQTKLIQLHGTVSGCDFVPGVMTGGFTDGWWATYNVADPSNCDNGKIQEDYADAPSMSVWHRAELIAQRSDYDTTNGTIIVKIDGQSVYSHVGDIMTRAGGTANWDGVHFMYQISGGTADWETWIDDTYAATSWARVEIGDAATYAASTHTEIQAPSSWTDSAITITANTGSFGSGEEVYLYVIDANGAVSPGTPITIEGELTCDINNLSNCDQVGCEALTPTHYWVNGVCSAAPADAGVADAAQPDLVPADAGPTDAAIMVADSTRLDAAIADAGVRERDIAAAPDAVIQDSAAKVVGDEGDRRPSVDEGCRCSTRGSQAGTSPAASGAAMVLLILFMRRRRRGRQEHR